MRILWALLFGLMCSALNASENLLGVSAYTLAKVGRFEIESMQLGEYEIATPYEVEAFVIFAGWQINGIVGCTSFFAPYQVQGGGKVLVVGARDLNRKVSCESSLESNRAIEAVFEPIFAKHFAGRFIVQGDDELVELVSDSGFRIRLVPSLSLEP